MDGPIDISNQQIASTIQTIVLELFNLFARPFVLVTKVFFHKEMGERYLNEIQALLCIILITGATIVSAATAGVFGTIVGIAWELSFAYCMWEHFRVAVPTRYKNGIRWHSRSDGMPRNPVLNKWVQWVILLAANTLAGITGLYGFSALLLMSLCISILSDFAATRAFWNRVLDAVDGQIEAEELGKAIENRLTPAQASGLKVCVPAYASPEFRKKIAGALNRRLNGPLAEAKVQRMPTASDTPVPSPAAIPTPTAIA